jgi:hypothetical protein
MCHAAILNNYEHLSSSQRSQPPIACGQVSAKCHYSDSVLLWFLPCSRRVRLEDDFQSNWYLTYLPLHPYTVSPNMASEPSLGVKPDGDEGVESTTIRIRHHQLLCTPPVLCPARRTAHKCDSIVIIIGVCTTLAATSHICKGGCESLEPVEHTSPKQQKRTLK